MNGSEPRVEYRCPRCGADLTASPDSAGKRTQCPECGGSVKVPGGGLAGEPHSLTPLTSPGQASQSSSRGTPGPTSAAHPKVVRGVDARTILITCPTCGCRVSADANETEVVCPDCLEALVIPSSENSTASDHQASDEPSSTRPSSAPPTPNAEDPPFAPQSGRTNQAVPDLEDVTDDLPLAPLESEAATSPGDEAPREGRIADQVSADLKPERGEDPFFPDTESPAPSDALDGGGGSHQAAPPTVSVEEFGFSCSVCGTRLIARTDQIGGTKKCPDCYTRHTIPKPRGQTARRSTVSLSVPPPPTPGAPTTNAPPGDEPRSSSPSPEPDDYQLAPPAEIASGFGLDSNTLEQITRDAHDSLPSNEQLAAELGDVHFGFRCTSCKSRIYAATSDIGGSLTCPECGTVNPVPAPESPKQKPRKSAKKQAVENRDPPRTTADDALDQARSEAKAKRAKDRVVEDSDLRDWVREFFKDPGMWLRLLPPAIGFAFVFTLLDGVVHYWNQGAWALFSMLLGVLAVMVALPASIYLGVCCQAIVGDTANGNQRVSNWPDGMFMEWWVDSLFILSAVFISATPGLLFGAAVTQLGLGAWVLIPLSLLSVWGMFPPIFLSMLHTGSPVIPYSPVIWQSVATVPIKWGRFYALSGGLAFGVMLVMLLLLPQWMILNVLVAPLVVAAAMLYCRLLGHLAWWCRDDFASLEGDDDSKSKSGSKSKKKREDADDRWRM